MEKVEVKESSRDSEKGVLITLGTVGPDGKYQQTFLRQGEAAIVFERLRRILNQ